MSETLDCPTCNAALHVDGEDDLRCPENHRYTVTGLALTINATALRALWMAVRALEDDAGSLRYMAKQLEDKSVASADQRREEADAALEAAQVLRSHAERAQARLDQLRFASSAIGETGSEAGRDN